MPVGGYVSGFRILGYLLVAPIIVGGVVILLFGMGDYNILIIPMIFMGEAILVLTEIIKMEKEDKVEEEHKEGGK